MKLTIKTKNHDINTSFIDYTNLTVIDNSTVELEIEKELSANEEQKLSSDYNVISFSYEVTEIDTDEVIQNELDKQVVKETSVYEVDEDEDFICILSDSNTELSDYKNKKLEKIYVNEEDIVYREIKDTKTADQIKTEAIDNGVEEWFFEEISDERLVEYTVVEIIKMWNETQKN